jgi:lysophospholipase-2
MASNATNATYQKSSSDVCGAARGQAKASIIFLHGLGDTGAGWASLIDEIRLPYMQYMCPTAPTIPVTLNLGFQMPSWFDIKSLDIDGPEDESGIVVAASRVHGMINNEIKNGIPANRIILGGFSQGGALALYAGLTYPEALAGIIGLSCWMPLHKQFPAARKCPDSVPILLCHGDSDPIVSYKFGQMSSNSLKQYMKKLQFKTYRGLPHQSCPEEIHDMKQFIREKLPETV